MYGPHSSHVEALLAALADPAIRRRRLRRHLRWNQEADGHRRDNHVYVRMRAIGRLEECGTRRG